MKLIFVTGLAGMDRKTIIDLAIQRSGRNQKFVISDFAELGDISSELKEITSSEDTRGLLSKFYSEVEKIVVSGIREHRENLIVSGFLTLDTPHGYMVSIPGDFFETFKPDNIVILEKKTDDKKTIEQQNINRHYAARYSAECNSFLNIIKFDENRLMGAVEKLSEVIKH
ncbi:MAG: hypothetical protein KAS04_03110 [Candidatus Aenigmarchaeota archaeon]|nr:hypothetical protein [Candidatus Aenigmarchaeota archaeon]